MRTTETTAWPFKLMSAGAERLGRFLQMLAFSTAALVAAFASSAQAQPQQIVNYGQVVVTGYSGFGGSCPARGRRSLRLCGNKTRRPVGARR